MMVPYSLRLLCLCLATFFLVNAVFGLMVSIASRAAVRISETMRPRSAARFLYVLRLLPLVLGAGAVLGLCVPSYLWLEPQETPERVGLACLTLALLASSSWLLSITRATRALAVSLRCNRVWRQTGQEARLRREASEAVIVEKEAPLLALAGLFRPHLVVSRGVLRALSASELDAALHHENAHCVSRDNLKRLLLLLAPDPIPFLRGFSLLEQAWAKFTEWAADDEAVQGDSSRALSLAAALLRVARMGVGPHLSFLHTSLVASDHDLSARVERLLRVEPLFANPRSRRRSFVIGSSLGMAVSIVIVVAWPATLSSVHRLLELFLR